MKNRTKPKKVLAGRNPLRIDPTRSITLRTRFAAQVRKGFARLRLALHNLVVKEDEFGLVPLSHEPVIRNSLSVNAGRWRFNTSAEKLKQFRLWLDAQLKSLIVGATEQQLWEKYVQEGFRKGAARAFDDANKSKKVLAAGKKQLDFYAGTRDQFLKSSFAQPVSVDKVKLLASRSFDEMEGMTGDMTVRMTRALADGLVQGKSPRDIADDLDDAIEIGQARALTIARTEIIRAHAEGQLQALDDLGVEEVGVAVEWSTTGDDRVCELCQPLEGVVLKLEEATGMLPRHPNCRCAWIPANVGEDSGDQKRSKGEIEEAFEEAGGGGPSVSKDRPKSVLNSLPPPTRDQSSRLRDWVRRIDGARVRFHLSQGAECY